ncbi:Protein PNS1 [Nakaseomyces glabratus]|uniref:Protein PNS1 n=1 Tax=Candida glabrata TaxID=5478 RepID=A0A0W0CZ51_CANGB|nr:Plasma-membrane choline transporter [Nakaseomyces glabratus]KAH7581456.1 Plasma-membrane choline transporter [Nakaseomyces glabratus]KAH7582717.1 Plasma-membrane choline transporter [Nakaseomyces glabratus]KAH7595018.1 Plasma-membrane choline transporter [Nakaseomyces glabratus]KAH7611102.1 Plasma-membrane choline transporter [Nakaseomyces glabratus]
MSTEKQYQPQQPPPAYTGQGPDNGNAYGYPESYGKTETHSGDSCSGDTSMNPQQQGQQYQFRKDDEFYNLNHEGAGAPIGSYAEVFPTEDNNKPKFNDWPFIIVFLLTLCGFIVVASLTLRAWSQTYSSTGSGIYHDFDTGTLNTNSVILLVFSVVIAIFFAFIGIVLCRAYPKFFIYAGMIVNILAALGTAIMYMSLKYWSAGIVFLIFTFMTAWCYWGMRSRIPLTVAILRVIVLAMKNCPQTLFVSFFGTIVASAFAMLFSTVVVATYMKYDPSNTNSGCNVSGGDCSHAKLIGVLVVVFFCGYYISEVIRNVMHCTVSGVFGSWYYRYKSDQGMPKWPAMGAFKRAMTYSFGSICFGSLIVSIIETFRQLLQLGKQAAIASTDNANWIRIIFWLIDMLVGFIQWIAQYFNHYAYCIIALYGKPYLKAAKQTWYMFREKGIDALINDNLVNVALGFYSLFASYMSCLFAFLYLRFTKPGYNSDGDFNAPLMAFAFVIALQLTNIANETIRSGCATFFTALGHDPEVFQAQYPDRFDEIFRSYPQVLNKLTHQDV